MLIITETDFHRVFAVEKLQVVRSIDKLKYFCLEYFLEDCIEMLKFVPPPKVSKRKDKRNDDDDDDGTPNDKV